MFRKIIRTYLLLIKNLNEISSNQLCIPNLFIIFINEFYRNTKLFTNSLNTEVIYLLFRSLPSAVHLPRSRTQSTYRFKILSFCRMESTLMWSNLVLYRCASHSASKTVTAVTMPTSSTVFVRWFILTVVVVVSHNFDYSSHLVQMATYLRPVTILYTTQVQKWNIYSQVYR